MDKIVKKWGDSLVIVFDKEDCRINNIKERDVMDFTINNIQTQAQMMADRNISKICEDLK